MSSYGVRLQHLGKVKSRADIRGGLSVGHHESGDGQGSTSIHQGDPATSADVPESGVFIWNFVISFYYLKFIGVWLIYSVAFLCAIQKSESIIHIPTPF